jgi:hypothetical protein
MAPGHRRAGLGEQLEQVPPADQDAGKVSEAVPAQLELTQFERDLAELAETQILKADRVACCCHRCQ